MLHPNLSSTYLFLKFNVEFKLLKAMIMPTVIELILSVYSVQQKMSHSQAKNLGKAKSWGKNSEKMSSVPDYRTHIQTHTHCHRGAVKC